MEDRHLELDQLTRAALHQLEDPRTIPDAPRLRSVDLHLRLWAYPSFAPYRSWAVYRTVQTTREEFTLRQATWLRPDDVERLTQPLSGLRRGFHAEPSIEFADRAVDPLEIEQRMQALGKISVPVAGVDHGLVLDGTQYGYESAEGRGEGHLELRGTGGLKPARGLHPQDDGLAQAVAIGIERSITASSLPTLHPLRRAALVGSST